MVETREKIPTDDKRIKRLDVKINPELKHQLEMEAARLDGGSGNKVYLYDIVEPAIERFLDVTAKLPGRCGPDAITRATGGYQASQKGMPVPVKYRDVVQGIVAFLENRNPPKTPEEKQLHDLMRQTIYAAARVSPE